MTRWVEIEQGEFLVEVDDAAAWRAIKLGWAFQERPWKERFSDEPTGHVSLSELVAIANTCPCDQHMEQLAQEMGFMP